jgi:hypothetical protein
MSVTISGSGTITGLDADGISSQPVFPGQVLQVLSTIKTDTFSTNAGTFVDVTGLSLSITPSSASNKILIMFSVPASSSSSAGWFLRLLRNSTEIALGDAAGSRIRTTVSSHLAPAGQSFSMAYQYLDSPATTSAVIYKLQLASQTGGFTAYINRSSTDTDANDFERGTSTITVMEIAA